MIMIMMTIIASQHYRTIARTATSGPLSAKLFGAGILLFSGSLYALVLTDEKRFGAVTPFGGACMIAGWVALGLGR
jgi:uncharacterized membrane protein YgdD (TMEM256/DUF423 family)